jgi:hypothetical protein
LSVGSSSASFFFDRWPSGSASSDLLEIADLRFHIPDAPQDRRPTQPGDLRYLRDPSSPKLRRFKPGRKASLLLVADR